MTVVTTVISLCCTVHATDSLITQLQRDGTLEPKEWKKSKIVPIRHWRGAMSYYGLAVYDYYNWSTFEWLQRQAQQANKFESAESFARDLAKRLDEAISSMRFQRKIHSGIGIHFSAYEYVDGFWIPELFHISNYQDTSYKLIRAGGIRFTRETYSMLNKMDWQPEHSETKYRLAVHKYLRKQNGMLVYNNGDPIMFNPVAKAILESIETIAKRGQLSKRSNVNTYRAVAKMAVEIVCDLQRNFVQSAKRRIGGKPHDLVITPNGEFSSNSGDSD